MPINVTEKKIKSKIKLHDRVAVIENIRYPYFDCTDDGKYKKLCDRMNDFYSSVAETYSVHARNKLPKKIKLNRRKCNLPMTLAMDYTIALCDEKIISVVLDLTYTEGKNVKKRRFSQMWSTRNASMLPVKEIIRTDKSARKTVYSAVSDMAKKNDETGAFGYFGDYLLSLAKSFDIRNCFAVPKGMCFYINAGILSPVKYGAASFVLSSGKLRNILKGDFLPKEDEKEAQNGNIVNNV